MRALVFKIIFLTVLIFATTVGAAPEWHRTLVIGDSTLDSTSLFDVVSTTQGARPFPSMTTTQRDNITSPATGLTVYNTTTDQINVYTGAAWAVAGPQTFDELSPMTTSGDIIYGGASGTGTRLAKGNDGEILTLAAGLPSWAAAPATGANTTLSNLTTTIAINQDLLPDIDDARAMGSVTFAWSSINAKNFNAIDANANTLSGRVLGQNITLPSTATPNIALLSSALSLDGVAVYSENNNTADANATGEVRIETGNKLSGTGDSGNITLMIGTSVGGAKGNVIFKDGSEGSVGFVWTSKDTSGAGSWEAATGGGGGGSKNYITNPEFEDDTDTATSAVGVSTSNAGLTILVNSTAPLAGSQDLILKKTATDMSDEFFTFDSDTVDLIDRGKTMTASFAWEPSGAYTDGFLQIQAVDQSAAALPVISDFISNGLPNFTGTVLFRIQTLTTTTEVNLRLVYIDATASAIDIGTLDEIRAGPDGSVPGFIATKWESFTPIVNLTNTTYTGVKRRIGDSMEVEILASMTGVPSALTLIITVPDGLSIDTTKTSSTDIAATIFGIANANNTGIDNVVGNIVYASTTTLNAVGSLATGADPNLWSNTKPFTYGSGDSLRFRFTIPISGWKATHLISTTENLFKNVDIRAEGNAAVSITANTPIDFIEVTDNTNSWNGSSFTAPSTSKYSVNGMVNMSASSTFIIREFTDGVAGKTIGRSNAVGTQHHFNGEIFLEKDQVLTIRATVTKTMVNAPDTHYISISSVKDTSKFSEFSDGGTAYIKDVKSANTAGGTFTSGAWRTRDLNVLSGDTGFISLSSNQFTLQPGKYDIYASAPAYVVDRHKIKLRDTTNSTDIIIGSSEQSLATNAITTISTLIGQFTISAETTFEIQHRCLTTSNTNGFGLASSLSVDEVYTQVKIIKK